MLHPLRGGDGGGIVGHAPAEHLVGAEHERLDGDGDETVGAEVERLPLLPA